MEVDQTQSEVALNALAGLICQLNVKNLDFGSSSSLFQSLGGEIQKSLSSAKQHPARPLCQKLNLDSDQWNKIDAVADRMTADYKKRAEMIIRRLDVTIDSFFWSERIQQLESQVNQVYNPNREALAEWQPLGVSDLLAATEDLLVLEKASSYKQRIATKSNISNFRMKEAPKDRGGRTGEIIAPVRETFSEQQYNRSGGGGRSRGNYRGRGRGGNPNQQRGNRFEDQVKREYNRDGNRGGGGHRKQPY